MKRECARCGKLSCDKDVHVFTNEMKLKNRGILAWEIAITVNSPFDLCHSCIRWAFSTAKEDKDT